MSFLDERKQRILKAIVDEHIETAEPVGSELLVQHYDFGVRPATIRNEMYEMSEMGYLRQPHTSAGRIPSDLGYRFYVDRLMEKPFVPRHDAIMARQKLLETAHILDAVLIETCRILSKLTNYTAVATQPIVSEAVISYVHFSIVGDRKLLLVIGLSDGRVTHRVINTEHRPESKEVARVSKILSARFVGKKIGEVEHLESDIEPTGGLYAEAAAVLKHLANDLSFVDINMWVEGTNYILKQPEFRDAQKMEKVLELLEERRRIYQLLTRLVLGPDVTIVIGSENPLPEMADTSFVATNYWIGNRIGGTIGVISATRMDYRRAVASVRLMAKNLGSLLTELSLT